MIFSPMEAVEWCISLFFANLRYLFSFILRSLSKLRWYMYCHLEFGNRQSATLAGLQTASEPLLPSLFARQHTHSCCKPAAVFVCFLPVRRTSERNFAERR